MAGDDAALAPAVGALILPVADYAGRELTGNHWLQFLMQLYASNRQDLAEIVRRTGHDSGLRLLARHLRAALPHCPAEIANQRFVLAMRQVVYALADWQRGVLVGQSGARMGSFGLFLANLIDMTVGSLAAPASAAARDLAYDSPPQRVPPRRSQPERPAS